MCPLTRSPSGQPLLFGRPFRSRNVAVRRRGNDSPVATLIERDGRLVMHVVLASDIALVQGILDGLVILRGAEPGKVRDVGALLGVGPVRGVAVAHPDARGVVARHADADAFAGRGGAFAALLSEAVCALFDAVGVDVSQGLVVALEARRGDATLVEAGIG